MGDLCLGSVMVVMPALDEERSVGNVIKALKAKGLHHIRVVDNGSRDATFQVAQDAGADVIVERRRGYGQACWTGMQHLPKEIKWVLFCDADGCEDLERLPEFFKAAPNYDFILGNRRSRAKGRAAMTPVQCWGNWLAGSLIRLGWGVRFEDLGPLRLIRREALERIGMEDRGFGWTVEMQAKAAELGLRCLEIGVEYRRRREGVSKISGTLRGTVEAGTVILGTLGKLFLEDVRVQRFLFFAAVLLLAGGGVFMAPYGDFREGGNVVRFLWGAGLMSLGFVCCWPIRSISVWRMLAVAVGVRAVLLFMYPGDDVWRYLWEGRIQLEGFSPYHHAPADEVLASLRTEWWDYINQRKIAAIYPPLTQLVFRGLAWVSTTVFCFKLAMVLADVTVCCLLAKRFGSTRTLLYAWNPLVLYGIAGGGHYDSLFVLAMVGGWLVFEGGGDVGRRWWAPLLFGMSVAMKWVTVPILGFALWRVYREGGVRRAVGAGVVSVFPFVVSLLVVCWGDIDWGVFPEGGLGWFKEAFPIVPGAFAQYAHSADLLPRLVGVVWPDSRYQNGVWLLPFGVCFVWLILKGRDLGRFGERVFFVLLVCSPLVHAWYFIWLAPFGVASKNWGIRLVSISVFVYFMLPYRQATEAGEWRQTVIEAVVMWLPFVAGFAWSEWKRIRNIS